MDAITAEQQQIKTELTALEARFLALKSTKQQKKEADLIASITSQAQELDHEIKAAPYIAFKQSEAYIQSLRDAIKSDGITATIINTGTEIAVKLSGDRKSLMTFDNLKAGQKLDCGGTSYFILSYTFSYAGSKADLLPVNSKAFIAPPGKKQTPYNAIECHWHHSTKRLTIPAMSPIKAGEVVTIGEACYEPAFTLLTPVGKNLLTYELKEVTADA